MKNTPGKSNSKDNQPGLLDGLFQPQSLYRAFFCKSHKMDRRKVWFCVSLTVTLTVTVLLVTGSPLLTVALDNDDTIPLGTFITWAGMMALPLTIWWGVRELRNPAGNLNTFLARFLTAILILAILWVPISYLLAGNLSFSFSEKESFQGGQTAMKWFWYLSYGIAVGSILILLIYWTSLLFTKGSRKQL